MSLSTQTWKHIRVIYQIGMESSLEGNGNVEHVQRKNNEIQLLSIDDAFSRIIEELRLII